QSPDRAPEVAPRGPGNQCTGNLGGSAQSSTTLNEHPFQTGQAVLYAADNGQNQTIKQTLPAPNAVGTVNQDLAINPAFYVMRVDANTIKLAKDRSDTLAGNAIKIVTADDSSQ